MITVTFRKDSTTETPTESSRKANTSDDPPVTTKTAAVGTAIEAIETAPTTISWTVRIAASTAVWRGPPHTTRPPGTTTKTATQGIRLHQARTATDELNRVQRKRRNPGPDPDHHRLLAVLPAVHLPDLGRIVVPARRVVLRPGQPARPVRRNLGASPRGTNISRPFTRKIGDLWRYASGISRADPRIHP